MSRSIRAEGILLRFLKKKHRNRRIGFDVIVAVDIVSYILLVVVVIGGARECHRRLLFLVKWCSCCRDSG